MCASKQKEAIMPVYKYECPCGHTCETLKNRCSSDDDTQICSACGGQMRRVIKDVSATFKGSGFYSTDYGKKP